MLGFIQNCCIDSQKRWRSDDDFEIPRNFEVAVLIVDALIIICLFLEKIKNSRHCTWMCHFSDKNHKTIEHFFRLFSRSFTEYSVRVQQFFFLHFFFYYSELGRNIIHICISNIPLQRKMKQIHTPFLLPQ